MDNKSVFQKLLRNIVILVIIITALILFQQKTYNDFISESISSTYLNDISFKAEKQFREFYHPIETSLIRSKKMGESGVLVLNDIESINATFIPILEELPQLHSVRIATETEKAYSLTREKDHWIVGVTDNKKDPQRILLQYWSKDRKLIKQEQEDIEYDIFQQHWFLSARDTLTWLRLRVMQSTGSQGVTASIKWGNKKENNQQYVLAFDLLLKEIIESVSGLRVSENSQVFIYRPDSTYFSLTDARSESNQDSSAIHNFVDIRRSDNTLVARAIQSWQEEGRPNDDAIDFMSNQTLYWVGIRSVDREHSDLRIGVIIPQNDIVTKLQRRQLLNISISAFIFLLGILIVFMMIRRHRKNITSELMTFVDDEHLEEKARRIIIKGEGKNIEFKSTMRTNLNTSQPGKEIELAWLKATTAFMNTDGGILLLGVNDGGGIIGMEADNFENDDKCRLHFKNLINQHIGAEFTNYLNFKLLNIDDKTIGLLECKPSQKPIFLKIKNEEHFYIRSGPSNIKLQTSKILEYIEDRKL